MARKWEILESKNRFYCDGRCLTGRDVGVFLFALFLITATTGLFFAFDCPYLTNRLSPAIPVFAALIFLSVICLFFVRLVPIRVYFQEQHRMKSFILNDQILQIIHRVWHYQVEQWKFKCVQDMLYN